MHRVVGEGVLIPVGAGGTALVDCPAGEVLSGGGYSGGSVRVVQNFPADVNTWGVGAYNVDSSQPTNITPYAICIGPAP